MSGSQTDAPAQKYVVMGAAGNPLAFYDSVLSPPPAGVEVVEISTAMWEAWVVNTAGLALVNGALVAYAPPPPVMTIQEQAVAALADGCAIVSASIPATSGTYAIDADSTNQATSVAAYIARNHAFPGQLQAFPWSDVAGNVHVFPTTDSFLNAASAWADYVVHLSLVAKGVGNLTLPSQPITIA